MFLCNDTATTEIYTLSLHDALPISLCGLDLTRVLPELRRDVRQTEPGVELLLGGDGFVVSGPFLGEAVLDRKSTRLNSSHANISYAVFCLKKTQTTYLLPLPSSAFT